MKLFLRIPAAGPIHPELSRWLVWFAREVPDADIDIFTNNIGIDRARNAICHQFLKSDCTHLWMIDHDVVPPRKIPWSAERHACWSGIYDHLMGHQLCKSAWKKNYYQGCKEPQGYVPCKTGEAHDAVSGGCMILSRELLEKPGKVYDTTHPYPWFETHFNLDGTISKGEDFDFCEKVKSAGEEIYLDPTYYCHHMKESSLKIIATRERMQAAL